MKTVLTLLLLLIASSSSAAQSEKPGRWLQDGRPVGNAPDRKAVNGFGAQLVVVKDPRGFIEMWHKPEKPEFESARIVGYNDAIGVIILFAGCTPNNTGDCNADVDYRIYKPDGKLLIERMKQRLWKDKPPPQANTQLGSAGSWHYDAGGLPSWNV